MTLTLFDSHCHFDFPVFDKDRENIWAACQASGVRGLMIPGVSPDQWPRAAQVAASLQGCFYSVGIHPWWLEKIYPHIREKGFDARDADDLRQRMIPWLTKPECRALGECGLDAMIDVPLDIQEAALACQITLAAEFNKPLILHCRKAHQQLLRLLSHQPLPAGGVIHAFSGSCEIAEQYWKKGFYLGIGGTITYERAAKTRAAVAAMPLEALLLETDAPDMPLAGFQGEPNNPIRLLAVAQCLARLRHTQLAEVAAHTQANACRLFGV